MLLLLSHTPVGTTTGATGGLCIIFFQWLCYSITFFFCFSSKQYNWKQTGRDNWQGPQYTQLVSVGSNQVTVDCQTRLQIALIQLGRSNFKYGDIMSICTTWTIPFNKLYSRNSWRHSWREPWDSSWQIPAEIFGQNPEALLKKSLKQSQDTYVPGETAESPWKFLNRILEEIHEKVLWWIPKGFPECVPI